MSVAKPTLNYVKTITTTADFSRTITAFKRLLRYHRSHALFFAVIVALSAAKSYLFVGAIIHCGDHRPSNHSGQLQSAGTPNIRHSTRREPLRSAKLCDHVLAGLYCAAHRTKNQIGLLRFASGEAVQVLRFNTDRRFSLTSHHGFTDA